MTRGVRLAAILIAIGASRVALAPISAQTPLPMREGHATVRGARLFFVDSGGDGVPVVFLHAATGTTRAWQHQVPAFTAAGLRVITYDRSGWGRTVVDAADAPAQPAADDLRELLDGLKLDRVHLVGTAGGGFVAFDFALAFPARLRSLVVADSIGGVRDQEILDLESRIRPPEFDALPPEVRELGPLYRASNPDGTRRWAEIEKESRPSAPKTSTLQLAYAVPMRNQLTLALLEQIRVPTLILTGGADMTAPPPLMKLLAARIRNAEFVVVPNAGHSTYGEDPEAFNRAVLDFTRKH